MTKVITIPDSWAEVNISNFQEIAALNLEDNNAKFIEIVAILSNEDPEIIKSMDIYSFKKTVDTLQWINEFPSETDFKKIITINGIEYGFINRLSDLTTGEWIDLENYLQNSNQNLHKIFSILYRPILHKFNETTFIIEKYEAESAEFRANLFLEHIMISDVYGSMVFFCSIVNQSMMTIQAFLNQSMSQTKKKISEEKVKQIGSNVLSRMKLRIRKIKNGCGLVMSIF